MNTGLLPSVDAIREDQQSRKESIQKVEYDEARRDPTDVANTAILTAKLNEISDHLLKSTESQAPHSSPC